MRPSAAKKIDALHAEIKAIIESEKAKHDKAHPDENSLWRSVEHCRLEMYRHCPQDRSRMVWATASLPKVGAAQRSNLDFPASWGED